MCVLDLHGLCSQKGDIWLDGILHICQLHQRSKCKSQHVRTLCGFVSLSWGSGVHKPMNGFQRNMVIVFSSVTGTPVTTPEWLPIFKGKTYPFFPQPLRICKRHCSAWRNWKMYTKSGLASDLKTPELVRTSTVREYFSSFICALYMNPCRRVSGWIPWTIH